MYCVTKILDESIQKETDTAPFLAGMFFDGFACLTASNLTEGVKGKWLVMCLKKGDLHNYLATPVPLPPPVFLFGSGLAGMELFRRRSRA